MMNLPTALIPIDAALGISVGNSELEAPRKPRSAAQIAAFEKARAKRAENMASKNSMKTPHPSSAAPSLPPTVYRRMRSHGSIVVTKERDGGTCCESLISKDKLQDACNKRA